jgi:hypothetical protein
VDLEEVSGSCIEVDHLISLVVELIDWVLLFRAPILVKKSDFRDSTSDLSSSKIFTFSSKSSSTC